MKLEPCPFCGSPAEIERQGSRRQSTIYQCTMCGCSLETGEEWGFGTDWNRRHVPEGFTIMSKEDVEAVRGKALEEAAKLADAQNVPHITSNPDATFDEGWNGSAKCLATAIRSLKSGGPDAD